MNHIQIHELQTIHWDSHPELFIPEGKYIRPQFTVIPSRQRTGIRIRWTYRYYSNEKLVLSFIAEQDIIIESIDSLTIKSLAAIIWECWPFFKGEFLKRTKEESNLAGLAEFDLSNQQLQEFLLFLKE